MTVDSDEDRYEQVAELVEPNGEGVLHYSDVLGDMASCLNAWFELPAGPQSLHDELYSRLKSAQELAARMEAAVRAHEEQGENDRG